MKTRIVYMGTPEFAVLPLQALLEQGCSVVGVVCQPDRPQGRHMRLEPPPVKKLAAARGIPVLQPEKVRTPDFEAALRALNPELIVTAAYGRILPPNILAVPRYGCLNVHASLLPAYRGAAPIQWSLIKGERETGVTIMLMDEGMDTGDILVQEKMAIPEDMDAACLSEQLSRLGARILPETVDRWLAGTLQRRPQNAADASPAPLMSREAGQVDWTMTAEQIHNLIRGTYPWPGAYTWCGDKKLKIHRAGINRDPEICRTAAGLPAGTLCVCGAGTMSVACGEGVLDLLEIQSESGKRLHCRDCAHNYRLGQKMGGGSHVD
ncbi:MAG: methionyl-tRNA formyltransferase [Clostridiaceae bacterium]|nr:methionyl-tRNA formyltransferase [Clostridiaceae bacterium]